MSRWGTPYDGVSAEIGPPGSGKTYSLARYGLAALRSGRPVFANAGFQLSDERTGRTSVPYRSLEEMLLVPNGALILLDEAPSMFSARRWQEFPDALMYRLTQIRKDGLEFRYSAVHESFVDKVLREMTAWFWKCRRVPHVPLFSRSKWAPEAFRRQSERAVRREWVVIRNEVCNAYDTLAKVAVPRRVWERMREASAEEWLTLDEWAARDGVPLLPEEIETTNAKELIEPGRRHALARAAGPVPSAEREGERERKQGRLRAPVQRDSGTENRVRSNSRGARKTRDKRDRETVIMGGQWEASRPLQRP